MAEYTNAEKADTILAYGVTDCNGRATQRLYAEKHPVRRTPAHTMFARLNQQLCETGSFRRQHDHFLVNVWAGILGDHLIGPYILPDRLTGPRYLIFVEQVLPELLDSAHVTAATRTSMWFQQDGAPHISVFLFGITWMQHVVNDGLPCRSSALASPIARPFLSGLFLLGANEILGVRNTRKQRRGTCSTHQCSSRGNTKHSRNVIECSTLHETKM
ncbi:uncharacterized protein TNCV_721921 [Trichonephila clavipes]|nr:uncharacterized protein TNCV_721921 [Trichonephila clavipes]